MSKTRITYTEEFRRNSVELLLSSGRPLKHVAAELGVSPDALRDWRNRATSKGGATQAGVKPPLLIRPPRSAGFTAKSTISDVSVRS